MEWSSLDLLSFQILYFFLGHIPVFLLFAEYFIWSVFVFISFCPSALLPSYLGQLCPDGICEIMGIRELLTFFLRHRKVKAWKNKIFKSEFHVSPWVHAPRFWIPGYGLVLVSCRWRKEAPERGWAWGDQDRRVMRVALTEGRRVWPWCWQSVDGERGCPGFPGENLSWWTKCWFLCLLPPIRPAQDTLNLLGPVVRCPNSPLKPASNAVFSSSWAVFSSGLVRPVVFLWVLIFFLCETS